MPRRSFDLLGAPVFNGETHVSVLPAALTRGLRAVLSPDAVDLEARIIRRKAGGGTGA